MFYQGKFTPTRKTKYKGDITNIVYRSSWELQVLKWCDLNPNIKSYSSEEVVVPYFYEADRRMHKYFVDFKITFKDGRTILVEVKPERETNPPKQQRKTKKYLQEALTFVKNQNKWKAADEFAKDRGWEFQVWTESTLKDIGILKTESKSKKSIKPMKKLKPLRAPKSKKSKK